MNKKKFYNFMTFLPAIIIFFGLIIWTFIVNFEKGYILLGALIILIFAILWMKYWADKFFEVKNEQRRI